MAAATPLANAAMLSVLVAFICLAASYATNDTSVVNVVQNSHSDKPMIYKITGTWGNHEGSMVLWVLVLTLCGAAVAAFGRAVALRVAGPRPGRAGRHRHRLPALHPVHVQAPSTGCGHRRRTGRG